MCSFTASVRRLRILVGGALLFTLMTSASAAWAQSDRGTIQGIVTDQSGGVVPDAKVELRHVATGTVTDLDQREGLYTAPNMPLGDYLVLITKDGFAPATGDGVNLEPASRSVSTSS